MTSYTQPIVDNPDSISHWSCSGNKYGESHHLAGIRCRYCHKTANELRDEQEEILQEWKRYKNKLPAGSRALTLQQWCQEHGAKKNSVGRHVSTN